MADYRFRLLAGTAVALTGVLGAGSALADTSLGWYVAADGGHGPVSSQSLTVSDVTLTSTPAGNTPPLADGDAELTPDYSGAGFARVGYRITPNLRAELEMAARPGRVADGLGGSDMVDLGQFDKTSLMANLIFDAWPEAPVHPYVGVGFGAVKVTNGYRESLTTSGHDLVYSIQSDTTVPAGQILAGATMDITERLHFDMTYRYLRTGSLNYNIAVSDTYTGGVDTYTAKAAGPIEDHSFTVGFRWTFGKPLKPRKHGAARDDSDTPPPAPVVKTATAAPAPAAKPVQPATQPAAPPPATYTPQTYASAAPDNGDDGDDGNDGTGSDNKGGVVIGNGAPAGRAASAPVASTAAPHHQYTAFFPLGSATLDGNSRAVIADAARYAASAPGTQVKVDGYADTSGSSAYNLALSRRRAGLVADELKGQGVPPEAITVAWHGESLLAVKTRDGVFNSKNRRVTISVALPGE